MTEIKSRAIFKWHFDVHRTDDDDWPDERPQPYSSTGRSYRPQRISLTFEQADMGEVKLYANALFGPRIVKAGPVGAIVDERLYGKGPDEPWFLKVVADCRAQIPDLITRGGES